MDTPTRTATRRLSRPDLDQLKREATELLKAFRASEPRGR